jgi:hypothetical protein
MPFDGGLHSADWGSTHPPTWDNTRTRARDYMKTFDLGDAQSYMYELDDFDKHMETHASTCNLDWHGFAAIKLTMDPDHPTHFAPSAAALVAGPLPLITGTVGSRRRLEIYLAGGGALGGGGSTNDVDVLAAAAHAQQLDQDAEAAATAAFGRFYSGGMCSGPSDATATSTATAAGAAATDRPAHLARLRDVAFRECSALAAGLGTLKRYTPFPLGTTISKAQVGLLLRCCLLTVLTVLLPVAACALCVLRRRTSKRACVRTCQRRPPSWTTPSAWAAGPTARTATPAGC